MNRNTPRLIALAALSLAFASAAPVRFEVATSSENVNVVTVESETAVENFTGRTSRVRGTLTFDPQARTGGGTVIIVRDPAAFLPGEGEGGARLVNEAYLRERGLYPLQGSLHDPAIFVR